MGSYLRSGLNYTTVDKLAVTLDTVFAGQALAKGEWMFNGPNLYNGKIFSNDGTRALILDGQNFVSLTVGGGFTANFQSTGLDLAGGKALSVGGQQVVGGRGAAVADATDAASAITQLNALLARCRAHGLIGP